MSSNFLREKFGGTNPTNVDPKPLTFRFVKQPTSIPEDHGDFYGTHGISNYFKNVKSPMLQWLFLSNRNSPVFNEVPFNIPINYIIENMKILAQPVYEGYIETNYEENFLEIADTFYESLFWLGELYISFNFFQNSSNYKIPDNTEAPEELEYYEKVGGIDLWVKCSGKVDDKDIKFMHLKTGMVFEIENWLDLFIRCRWNNLSMSNFTQWFQYSMEWLMDFRQMNIAKNLSIKRVHLHGRNDVQRYAKTIEARINSESTILSSDEDNKNHITPNLFMSTTELKDFQLALFLKLDRRVYELGRVANTNPKQERMTTGENYKDITSLAARQKSILTQLKRIAVKVYEMWGLEWNFAINGIPEKQLIEEDNLTAPNPNKFDNDGAEESSGVAGKAGEKRF